MYQNYYQPQVPIKGMMQQPQMPIGLKGRPISSIEEVRAASIDFDGSITFFPNLGDGKIYTKQIGPDGTAVINMYQFTEFPPEPSNINLSNYITREEFESVISQLIPQAPEPEPSPAKEYSF